MLELNKLFKEIISFDVFILFFLRVLKWGAIDEF
jgi:hypothetical protein